LNGITLDSKVVSDGLETQKTVFSETTGSKLPATRLSGRPHFKAAGAAFGSDALTTIGVVV